MGRQTVRVAVAAEHEPTAGLLLQATRQFHPDARLELVVPARRVNDARNVDELARVVAFDREASALGRRDNVQYVLERLGRPRRGQPGFQPGEERKVRRQIREGRERFKFETMFLDGRTLIPR